MDRKTNNQSQAKNSNQNTNNQNSQNQEEIYKQSLNKLFQAGELKDFQSYILQDKPKDIDEHVNKIKEFVKQHCIKEKSKGISGSQLRNLFHEVSRAKTHNELKLLRPKFAYAAGRAKNSQSDENQLKQFVYLLDELVQKVDSEPKLKSFKYFFESVIAYHKYFGGKY